MVSGNSSTALRHGQQNRRFLSRGMLLYENVIFLNIIRF